MQNSSRVNFEGFLSAADKMLKAWGRRTMSTLSELSPAPGSTRQQNRVGRGPGSGRGKTAGRGTKGQKARHGVHPWFEGGQTPITKLFPKVGFNSKLPQPSTINLGEIQRLIDTGRLDPSIPITMREIYKSKGIKTDIVNGVKVLGRGSDALKQPITLSASRISDQALSKIEELGGKFTAEFYTKFGMRALTRPEATLEKYGRIPLRARPVDRRNIEFYRDPSRRGYLADTPGAPKVKPQFQKNTTRVSPLVAKLQELEKLDPSKEGARLGFI